MKALYSKTVNMLTLLVFSILLLSGCSYSIGSVNNDWGGKIDASYVTFNGQKDKSIKLDEGEKLIMEYKVTVNKGSLTINITGPDGNILWEKKFTGGNTDDTAEITAQKAGTYVINFIGEKTGGGYHIKLN
jgi:hypothetical protein